MSGSSSTIKTRSMPDILPSYQEYDHLRDISRMVAHAFQMFRDEDQLDGARDRARVFQHVRQQLTENLLVEVVDHIVPGDHLLGQAGIRVHKGVEAVLQDL